MGDATHVSYFTVAVGHFTPEHAYDWLCDRIAGYANVSVMSPSNATGVPTADLVAEMRKRPLGEVADAWPEVISMLTAYVKQEKAEFMDAMVLGMIYTARSYLKHFNGCGWHREAQVVTCDCGLAVVHRTMDDIEARLKAKLEPAMRSVTDPFEKFTRPEAPFLDEDPRRTRSE